MSIRFSCHGCGTAFTVDDANAGARVRCQRCGSILEVPKPDLGVADPGVIDLGEVAADLGGGSTGMGGRLVAGTGSHADAFPSMAPKPSSGASMNPAWIAGGIAAGVALVVVVLLVLSSLFGKSEPAPAPLPIAMNDNTSPSTTGNPSPTHETVKPPPQAPVAKKPDPPAKPVEPVGFHIPFDRHRTTFTAGPLGCPVVIAGQEVWHLGQEKIVQRLQGEYQRRGMRKLSANGDWFVAASKSPNQTNTDVNIWHTPSGELRATIPGNPKEFVDVMLIVNNEHVVTGGRHSGTLVVWDIATGRRLRTIDTPNRSTHDNSVAFTRDGKHFAAFDYDNRCMCIFETVTNQRVAKLEDPLAMSSRPGEDPIEDLNADFASRKRIRGTDAIFIVAWMQGLEFSPDGQMLAGVSTSPRPRLICWDRSGKLLNDAPLDSLPRTAFWEHYLQWTPDSRGLLVTGNIFDVASRRIVLNIPGEYTRGMIAHVLDDKRLLGVFPANPTAMTLREVPWERLRNALAMLEKGGDAVLAPGQSVSLEIELGDLRGSDAETLSWIERAMTRRLARDGIRVAAGSRTTFRMRFAETAGDTLPIHEMQSMFDQRGRDTGRKATVAKGTLVAELLFDGKPTPVWRETIRGESGTSFTEAITNYSMRQSMLKSISSRIARFNFPYFIPESDDVLALPALLY